jgi:hypothetical protein
VTEPVLVVDFGAWRTSAAVVLDDGQVRPVSEPTTGSLRWPSTALLDGETLLIGDSARHRRDGMARWYVDGIRPAVDAGATIRVGEHEFTGVELLAAYLSGLRGEAQRQAGGAQLRRLVLVVPAGSVGNDGRNQRMVAVAQAAGFPDAELVSDAVAAIADPFLLAPDVAEVSGSPWAPPPVEREEGSLLLVCDLGLSWAVTLCQWRAGRAVPIGHEESAAGSDLDALLVRDLRATQPHAQREALAAGGEAAALAQFEAADLVRRLKHRLADWEEVEAVFDPDDRPYRLHRDDVRRCAEPALRWLVASARAVVARSGHGVQDVAEVILVGGAARIPSARAMLEEGLWHAVRLPAEPDLAVLRGAARWAVTGTARVLPADLPTWRIEPLAWPVPDSRLVRWLVDEGQQFARGAVLAQARTDAGRILDLTARQDGILAEQCLAAGASLRADLVAGTARSVAMVAGDRLTRRHRLHVTGEWLLTPDRNFLVECPTDAGYVKVRSIETGAVVAELRPDRLPAGHGRVFLSPAGSLTLVAWQESGQFRVWDVATGDLLAAFREAARPLTVLVNEPRWRLVTEVDKRVQVGRYRRDVVNVWDLTTGVRVDEQLDDRQFTGYGDRSPSDSFATVMHSPDGRLRAATSTGPGGASLTLLEAVTDQEIFHTDGVPGARWVRTAFSGDGQHLLASWHSDEASWVDVWRI